MSVTGTRTETFTGSDGVRLAYTLLGDGPLLVCHPGGPGRAAAYLEDLGGLATTRTLLLLDVRGTGGSSAPADPYAYGPGPLAADLEALRAHLGLETFDLLGHSAGGRVAQLYAAEHPERIRRLALICTYLSTDFADARTEVQAKRAGEPWYAEAADAAEGMSYAPAGEKLRLERMLRPFWYGRWTEREAAHAATADHQVNPRVAARFTAGPGFVDALEPRLAAVTAPVLVVGGELDGLTPPACAAEVAGAFPHATLDVLPGAGHFPWVDAPEAFRASVEAFLAG